MWEKKLPVGEINNSSWKPLQARIRLFRSRTVAFSLEKSAACVLKMPLQAVGVEKWEDNEIVRIY